jgi:uncharacterized membrane protein YhhN
MTYLAWACLAVTAVLMVTDWVAVIAELKRLEYLAKPASMVGLAAVAITLDVQSLDQQRWFLLALAFGAAGDVFLMLPRNLFLAGLTAFLLGHLAYLAGFLAAGIEPLRIAIFAAVVLLPGTALVPGVVQGIIATGRRYLVAPVLVYSLTITIMVGSALASGRTPAVVGGLLFYASDTLIGYSRFVFQRRWLPVAIIVTYHLGQLGLVLSLAR